MFISSQIEDLKITCRSAEDKTELIELLKQKPDSVVVLDYTLFDINDIDELEILGERFPLAQWVLFSVELSLDFVRRAIAVSPCFSILLKESTLHEIRECLQYACRGQRYICQRMTELLEQPGLDEEKRLQYAERIDSQVARITWLIRNLLALSQIEAGMLRMKMAPVELTELTEDITASLDIMAELKGVALVTDIPAVTLNADRHWLREALMNIIKNCIEHTDEGGKVDISARQNNIFTEITIEDNGSGISESDLPHIFERFYKAENASAQSVGIGLALAKQIIGGHGGIIDAASTKGVGTRFTIKIYSS